jgi:AraC-like DNA-binding protein
VSASLNKSTRKRRALLEEIRLAPTREWLNTDAAWRFLRLHSGAAYWLGAPETRALSEGDLIVIAPQVTALVRASELNQVVLHTFSFAPELLAELFNLSNAGETRAGQIRFLPGTHSAARRFADLITNGPQTGRLGQRAEALRIVADLFEAAEDGISPSSIEARPRLRFEQLMAQTPDTELIHQTVSQLAELCHCTPRHFNRLFRKHFGISIRNRQTELRLMRARSLLSSSNDPIQKVAAESGYRNLSLFHSLFRRRFGMTPSDLRKSIQPPDKTSAELEAQQRQGEST